MLRPTILLLLLAIAPKPPATPAAQADGPSYTSDNQLKMPANYREWIYLTSGLDMSYNPKAGTPDHSQFDNVFVNPSSYRAFLQTGTWPDRTTFILEVRSAQGPASINKRGHSQSPEILGVEVHVKDAKLEGGWGFFEFDRPEGTAKLTARPAACYQCHESHAAVDTTFVQFYPTLIDLAKTKATLSAAYLKDTSEEPK
jgi:Cytochrome P460